MFTFTFSFFTHSCTYKLPLTTVLDIFLTFLSCTFTNRSHTHIHTNAFTLTQPKVGATQFESMVETGASLSSGGFSLDYYRPSYQNGKLAADVDDVIEITLNVFFYFCNLIVFTLCQSLSIAFYTFIFSLTHSCRQTRSLVTLTLALPSLLPRITTAMAEPTLMCQLQVFLSRFLAISLYFPPIFPPSISKCSSLLLYFFFVFSLHLLLLLFTAHFFSQSSGQNVEIVQKGRKEAVSGTSCSAPIFAGLWMYVSIFFEVCFQYIECKFQLYFKFFSI